MCVWMKKHVVWESHMDIYDGKRIYPDVIGRWIVGLRRGICIWGNNIILIK